MNNAQALVEVVKVVCGTAVIISFIYFMHKTLGGGE